MESRWKEIGNKLERIGEFAVLGGDGGNARKRGECQAGVTDDVRYMVFVLKTRKYGSKNDFYSENCWLIRKNLNNC